MVKFKSSYIESKVRNVFERTAWRRWTPPSKAEILTQDALSKIKCISISSKRIFDIRETHVLEWYEPNGSYWTPFTWSSLNLNYNVLKNEVGWEDDLQHFSHIHTFYCDEQKASDSIYSFKKVKNLGLSNVVIKDWSFITKLKKLYSISLIECGDNGNQAVEHICSLICKQRERDIGLPLCFIKVIGMQVCDLTPFKSLRINEDPTQYCNPWELNLSNNEINDVSPLSGVSAGYLVLENNKIDKFEEFDRSNIYWIFIDGNYLNPEDLKDINDKNTW